MPMLSHFGFGNSNLCITSAEGVSRGINIRMITLLIIQRVHSMWVFPPPVQLTTMSELGRCGWSRQKHASSWIGCTAGTPKTEAEAETIQSFSLLSTTPDSASASSVSVVTQLSLKLSLETVWFGWGELRQMHHWVHWPQCNERREHQATAARVHLSTWWRLFELEFFFGVGRRSFAAKNKEESKIVNVS